MSQGCKSWPANPQATNYTIESDADTKPPKIKIDWNKVAHDPILAQEITNGHAARMRYSRFRAQMLGLEPQRRKRDGNKARVTKKKKDDKTAVRKEEDAVKSEGGGAVIKRESDSVPRASGYDASRPSTAAGQSSSSPRIKTESMIPMTQQESQQHSVLGSCPPPPMQEMHAHMHQRLLTPCSDSDVMTTTSQGFTPSSDMFHADPVLDFGSPAPHCSDASLWHQSPPYSGFAVGYGLDNYQVAFCDHSHMDEHHSHGHNEHHLAAHLGVSQALLDQEEANHVMVKHEEWDMRHHFGHH